MKNFFCSFRPGSSPLLPPAENAHRKRISASPFQQRSCGFLEAYRSPHVHFKGPDRQDPGTPGEKRHAVSGQSRGIRWRREAVRRLLRQDTKAQANRKETRTQGGLILLNISLHPPAGESPASAVYIAFLCRFIEKRAGPESRVKGKRAFSLSFSGGPRAPLISKTSSACSVYEPRMDCLLSLTRLGPVSLQQGQSLGTSYSVIKEAVHQS